MFQDSASKNPVARPNRNRAGERRIITVLFCDVVGSTALAEQFDPEDWADIMNEVFEYLNEPIYRFGGTVARLMGDGILALFGAPFAHEDDPERAVLAGLAIVEGMKTFRQKFKGEYGLEIDVRVGINTGPVVVGDVGSAQAGEYTAMGDAVNLASRMEQTADPGTVQISMDTFRPVAPLFDVKPLGGIEVKGKNAPVPAYVVIRSKERPGKTRGIEGLSSPLIGRQEEFDKLTKVLQEVRQGRGQIVCLIGEAGLGKSRLIEESQTNWEKIKNDDSPVGPESWTVTRGISYDTTRPYGLFMQRVRQVLNIDENTPPEMVRDRIEDVIAAGDFTEDHQRQAVISAVETLLAIQGQSDSQTSDGETLKRELYSSVLEVWRQMANRTEIVMVFDDLHWADPASADLLIHLFQLVEDFPILYLCAMRPERGAPGWKIKEAAESQFPERYTEINLSPLTSSDSDVLVENLLHVVELPPHLHESILAKTDGNPFFVEEVVRTLIDRGVVVRDGDGTKWQVTADLANIEIPQTLQGLLLARIDRLEKEARETLQLASVIGRTFYYHILGTISDAATELDKNLESLQQLDLIRESESTPELQYIFKHELTRDAAYNSILRRRCRILHRLVVEAMESLYAERIEDEAHLLAYHAREAGDNERALKYSTVAGNVALRMYANAEAETHYRSALEIAKNTDDISRDQLIHLYVSRGRALHADGQFDDALKNYRELESLGVETGDPEMELEALIPQAIIHSTFTVKFNPEQGDALSKRALDIAREIGDPKGEANALWCLLLLESFAHGNPAKAIVFGEESLKIAREHNFEREMAYILNDLTRPYFASGDLQQAMAALEESRGLWRELGIKPMLTDNLQITSDFYYRAGKLDEAMAFAEEGLKINESISNWWGLATSKLALAPIYLERGEFGDSIKALEEAIPLVQRAAFSNIPGFIETMTGLAYGLSGDIEYGLELVHPGLDETREYDWSHTLANAISGLLNLQNGNLPGANDDIRRLKESLHQAPTDAPTSLSTYFQPFFLLAKIIEGEVTLANGDCVGVVEIVDGVLDDIRGTSLKIFTPDLFRLKGQALLALGKVLEARGILEEARAQAQEQGSRRSLWQILHYLSIIEGQLGKAEDALNLKQQAQELIEYIANHVGNPERREKFLKLPNIQEVMNA